MRLAVDLGHGVNDGGAVGIRNEIDLINEVGAIVIAGLKEAGHQVLEVRPSRAKNVRDSLRQRVTMANFGKCDRFISIHFNKFEDPQANGAEVFAISAAGIELAASVLAEICALGFRERGVKNGSHLFVIRNTAMPAILIEGCFISSPRDMLLYDKEQMSGAILKGLLKVLGTPKDEDVEAN